MHDETAPPDAFPDVSVTVVEFVNPLIVVDSGIPAAPALVTDDRLADVPGGERRRSPR